MVKRAYRRQQDAKRKAACAAFHREVCNCVMTPELLARLATVRTPCSCPMCGNARKWAKGKDKFTIQEKRHDDHD